MRQNREGLTEIKLFQKPHYRSILFLLNLYKKDGLTLLHLRYVLEKNYKNNTDPQVQATIKKMEIFYDSKLIKAIKNGLITEGCITSRQNLYKFIKILKRMDIIVENKSKKRNEIYYKINKDFKEILEQMYVYEIIQKISELEIIPFFLKEADLRFATETKYVKIFVKIEKKLYPIV
ncbi:MAG: hypothetical protein AMJ90_06895 [candidate division Zixibacteria bacterium SM23_73_2]|nr:MAG: hypothetical protein AMJ90_06895 [candidate division Zixibacteria bacterium SM23_73_2]